MRDENVALREQLKQAQELIQLQDNRRFELSEMLSVGFWEWDEISHKPTFYSPEMANVLGVDKARLDKLFRHPEEIKQILHPDDLLHYEENMDSRNLLKPGVSRVFEYRILVDQGEIRFIREFERGVFDEEGMLESSFGMVQNITEEQVAVDSLRESEERHHSMFEQLPLAVQEQDYSAIKKVVDKLLYQGVEDIEEYFLENPRMLRDTVRQSSITSVNEALLTMHGVDSLQAFLTSEADFDGWWDAQWGHYYAAEIAALAGDRKLYETERVDSKFDGTYFETRVIVTLARGSEDSWERVITIHEDISDRKKAESALIEAMTQAERANQVKSDFLSSMSHELRTPLNAILGYAQLFTYDRSLSKQNLAHATEISRASKHLMSLIDQILDLSRIEAGEADVSLEPVSLEQVLVDSINWITQLAQERQVRIDFDLSQFSEIKVVADSIRLKQVFLNLLSNAVKYNRQGGRVEVVCDAVDSGSIRIGVRDTGAGISPVKLNELFQPFNRLGAEFSGIDGSGIGLVISRQLIDLMKGELNIESEVGVGSTFWVVLQLAPALAPVSGAATSAPAAISRVGSADLNLRILVAEDNLMNQKLMEAQLDMLGYQADYAQNGSQALAHWRQGNYALLLTDIGMPEMNGYELVREIRLLERNNGKRTPLIAITTNALAADVEKCLEVGMDDVIAKPLELQDLRLALEKWAPLKPDAPQQNAAVVTSAETPADVVIDFDVLTQTTGDRPELHRSLLRSYEDALEPDLNNIRQAFAWKNSEQIVEYAHRLKSSSRSMGIIAMGEICEQIESKAKQQAWPRLERLMPELRRLSNAAVSSIEAFLQHADESPAPLHVEDADDLGLPDDDDEDVTQFSIKLMLLDDDHIMHRVTSVMLNDLGVSRVVNVMSATAALDILQSQGDEIDVIICDLNMPDVDGVEFIRHLAKRNYEGSLILTSGEDLRILKSVEKLAIEHNLHVLGVLEKPPTPAKLGELLDTLDQIQQEGTLMQHDAITVQELEHAIENNELEPYFQPKIDIASRQIVGVEALARWNHPLKGLIKPDAFITMAENHGLIGALTDNICRKAMEYAARLKALDHDLNIAINLSVDILKDLDWPEKISGTLKQYGLEPSDISFEITESGLMENVSVALDILNRLSLKRFNLSIDDFGTGYSSMEQLQRIPFSEFKIDRAFVHDVAREASALAILESSVLLAKKLNMKVVAEGVENQQDWDVVAQVGCDLIQGYYVSRPLSFPQLLKWLDDPDIQKKFLPDA